MLCVVDQFPIQKLLTLQSKRAKSDAYELLEKNLAYVGISAIEDKLQEGSCEFIKTKKSPKFNFYVGVSWNNSYPQGRRDKSLDDNWFVVKINAHFLNRAIFLPHEISTFILTKNSSCVSYSCVGDKYSTAIQISTACNLISPGNDIT